MFQSLNRWIEKKEENGWHEKKKLKYLTKYAMEFRSGI